MDKHDAVSRKNAPMARGLLDYFPDALAEVAEVSRIGAEQHHPGTGIWWDKTKSADEPDCILRHLIDRGKRDTDGTRHSAKVAWRALAMLQREIDAEQEQAEKLSPATPTAIISNRELAILQRELEAEQEQAEKLSPATHTAIISNRAPPQCPDVDGDISFNPPEWAPAMLQAQQALRGRRGV